MKDKLYQLMMDHKVKSFETDRCIITLVLPTEATSIDTKALRESHPRIAKKFEKTSPKKGYTKVSVKNEGGSIIWHYHQTDQRKQLKHHVIISSGDQL